MELPEQMAHRLPLGAGAGVAGTTLHVQAAFVADADAVAVVILAVGALHAQGTTDFNGAVAADHKVKTATVFPTTGLVPAVDFANAALLIRTHGAAVDDD